MIEEQDEQPDETARCMACGEEIEGEPDGPPEVCTECEARYPASLIKALGDEFDYAMGLRNGTVLRFQSARITGEWVTIELFEPNEQPVKGFNKGEYPCPRGVDIRISEIIWCADAPQGS